MEFGPYCILEGADGTGKTTFAEEIVRRTGASYIHCGPPDGPALEFYLRKLRSVRGPMVVDRLHVGSYVYGLAFRNTPDLTEFENWLLEGFLYAHGATLVYCTVPPEVVGMNLARGPDNADAAIYEAAEKRALVRELYEERIPKSELSWMRYDYTVTSLDAAAGASIAMLNVALYDHGGLPELDAIGNTVNPEHILIADRPSWYDRADKRARGMTPIGRLEFLRRVNRRSNRLVLASSAGRYMHMALRSAGLRLQNFALFNSVQGDGREFTSFAYQLPSSFWSHDPVALGRNAANQMAQRGTYRLAPHPQHWRRFHYKDVLGYGEILCGIREWKGCGPNSVCRGMNGDQ